ncbi:P-loop containing nucleoside triphosphate hydrolase protein [Mycena floridula]|nr:P-loop containing nucleoside triphosphate hydrolase protein [Mycena floridula]
MSFLNTLQPPDALRAWQYCFACWYASRQRQCPRQLQLEAALHLWKRKDVLVKAGTGSGKTLIAVLNQLLERGDGITLMLDPLKRLQTTHASDITRLYDIETLVVNEDTPRDEHFWQTKVHNLKTKTPGSAKIIIATPEQLFKLPHGHLTKLGYLIRDGRFKKRIRLVVADEIHFAHFAGLSRYGIPAFRACYGQLREIRTLLGLQIPWLALTATAPPHMLKSISNTVLRPNHITLSITSNRPNTIYATHCVVDGIKNLENFRCLVKEPFTANSQPSVLVFLQDNNGTIDLANFLNDVLPLEHRDKGYVRHYHGGMSKEYLDITHKAFINGECLILISTSGESTGIDFLRVDIVAQLGLPENGADALQKGGRAVRLPGSTGLVVFFYDPWVLDIELSEFDSGDLDDPDRPRRDLKKTSSAKERAALSSVRLMREHTCIRKFFADYLNDVAPDALIYLTGFCCDRHSETPFDLNGYLPSPLFVLPEPPSNDESSKKRAPQGRPTKQRSELKYRLESWLDSTRKTMFTFARPTYLILPPSHLKMLLKPLAGTLTSPHDVAVFLDRSKEWEDEWGKHVYAVIENHDLPILEKAAEKDQKRKASTSRKRARVADENFLMAPRAKRLAKIPARYDHDTILGQMTVN